MTLDHRNHDRISSATGTAVMSVTAHRTANLAKTDAIMGVSLFFGGSHPAWRPRKILTSGTVGSQPKTLLGIRSGSGS
jgi:hypothetical protein